MSGTRTGGVKSAETIKKLYGNNYYINLGKLGGKAQVAKGYATEKVDKNGLTGPQRAKVYGSIAGQLSHRKPRKENK